MTNKAPAVIALLIASAALWGAPQAAVPAAQRPSGSTRCDVSLPMFVEIVPLGEPAVGRATRFEVRAESRIDPDLVRRSWIEYQLPARLRRPADAGRRDLLGADGRGRTEMDLVFPAEDRYEIRARLVVELTNGKTISHTAVRWVELGPERPPEGMIGRIVNPDGTGVRVYSGVTVRN